MKLSKAALAAASLLAIAAFAGGAEARHHYRHSAHVGPRAAEQRVVVGDRVCTKICPQDYSPCDPIYFKTADGRCAAIYSK